MADTVVAAAERTLPHNLEAERSVLVLVNWTDIDTGHGEYGFYYYTGDQTWITGQ